jgi:hypothetical protein
MEIFKFNNDDTANQSRLSCSCGNSTNWRDSHVEITSNGTKTEATCGECGNKCEKTT